MSTPLVTEPRVTYKRWIMPLAFLLAVLIPLSFVVELVGGLILMQVSGAPLYTWLFLAAVQALWWVRVVAVIALGGLLVLQWGDATGAERRGLAIIAGGLVLLVALRVLNWVGVFDPFLVSESGDSAGVWGIVYGIGTLLLQLTAAAALFIGGRRFARVAAG